MEEYRLQLKDFEQAGLIAEEVFTDIFVVRNFLKEDEVLAIRSQIDLMTDDDWKVEYTTSLYNFIKNQYGVDTFEEAQALGHRIDIDSNWVDKNARIQDGQSINDVNARLSSVFAPIDSLEFRGIGSIQRQYEGVKLNEHVDSESDPLVAYACVMYINDDFTGGELNFPKLGYRYKPEARSLIVFPSRQEYLHGVLPVGPGPTRYALPAFVGKVEK
jgi:hypothetical protein